MVYQVLTLWTKNQVILDLSILVLDMATIMSLLGREPFAKASRLKFSGSIVLVLRSTSAKFQPPDVNGSLVFSPQYYFWSFFVKMTIF